MAGHTPGPWRVIHHNSGASRVLAGSFEILLTSRTGAKADVWTANANLIAAAPELLAALKEIANVEGRDPDGQHDTWSDIAARCIGMATAAIAKAEGR